MKWNHIYDLKALLIHVNLWTIADSEDGDDIITDVEMSVVGKAGRKFVLKDRELQ